MKKQAPQFSIRTGKLGDEIYVKDFKSGGYTVYFKDFPKIVTQGETIKEARDRLWRATYDTLKFFFNDGKN